MRSSRAGTPHSDLLAPDVAADLLAQGEATQRTLTAWPDALRVQIQVVRGELRSHVGTRPTRRFCLRPASYQRRRTHVPSLGGDVVLGAYKRRQPENTGLWQAVQRHWLPFLHESSDRGAPPPKFVQRGFQKYLTCGILAHGFARVRCTSCGDDRLVALSCKVRGLCPSCDGRRMIHTAAHLIDSVIPHVPVRQFVFTVPYWLRFKIAWNTKLFGEVHKVFTNTMRAWARTDRR